MTAPGRNSKCHQTFRQCVLELKLGFLRACSNHVFGLSEATTSRCQVFPVFIFGNTDVTLGINKEKRRVRERTKRLAKHLLFNNFPKEGADGWTWFSPHTLSKLLEMIHDYEVLIELPNFQWHALLPPPKSSLPTLLDLPGMSPTLCGSKPCRSLRIFGTASNIAKRARHRQTESFQLRFLCNFLWADKFGDGLSSCWLMIRAFFRFFGRKTMRRS